MSGMSSAAAGARSSRHLAFVRSCTPRLGVGRVGVLTHSAAAFQVVKTAGASYPSGRERSPAMRGRRSALPEHRAPRAPLTRRCFLEGLLSNVLNPRRRCSTLALPAPNRPTDPAAESLLLAGIHYAEAIVCGLVVVSGDRMRRLFPTSAVQRWLDGLGVECCLSTAR